MTLVLGGARSGKSALAERMVRRSTHGTVVYLATGTPTDADMQARIDEHKRRRGTEFETVEAGRDLAAALVAHADRAVLVDSLGTWVSAHPDLDVDIHELLTALGGRRAPTVLVSDEVGMSVHPTSEVGRRFRDVLGAVNEAVGVIADQVLLVVAGRVVRLETFDDHLR
jgi:adenosylcobinamide kinase/adenosylcobinamide-phosphate guanylyltransferase